MSTFEFYLTFEAILYGLIVTKFLSGWNDLIANSKNVKFYWAHVIFTFECFAGLMIRIKGRLISEDWKAIENVYQMMFYIILIPALLYFVFHQSFPPKDKTHDIKQFIVERRLHIFIPLILFGLMFALEAYLNPSLPLKAWQLALMSVLMLPLILLKNLRYFEIGTVLIIPLIFYAMYVT